MADDTVRILDGHWLRDHPIPAPERGTDKNGRGRVMVVGGCALVPGGIQLTAEAALRAGAGKVQIATIASAALPIGIAMPEVAVITLPEGDDGEIGASLGRLRERLARNDALIVGPAMSCQEAAGRIVDAILEDESTQAPLIIDAAALQSLPRRRAAAARSSREIVLTPHIGEMAALMECDAAEIERDRAAAVASAARKFGAVVVLKGETSLIAAPGGERFAYAGGGVGLATGGSGDVLAGITAGLAARGLHALDAALWAVWLHGEAGRRCAEKVGPIGFLARELLAQVPPLLRPH